MNPITPNTCKESSCSKHTTSGKCRSLTCLNNIHRVIWMLLSCFSFQAPVGQAVMIALNLPVCRCTSAILHGKLNPCRHSFARPRLWRFPSKRSAAKYEEQKCSPKRFFPSETHPHLHIFPQGRRWNFSRRQTNRIPQIYPNPWSNYIVRSCAPSASRIIKLSAEEYLPLLRGKRGTRRRRRRRQRRRGIKGSSPFWLWMLSWHCWWWAGSGS